MPFAFKVIIVCFGATFFLAHLAWALYAVRFYTARDDKLEAAGKVVPGFAGLLMVAAALLAPSGWSVVCGILAIPLMVVGRAVYELIVFRKSGRDPAAH
jgi:hypothetical protein